MTKNRPLSRYNKDQNKIVESRFMTNGEVAELLGSNGEMSTQSIDVGDDEESKGKLTFTLWVIDYGDRTYKAVAKADWENRIYNGSGSDIPSKGDDFLGITWGGDGELKKTDLETAGEYQFDEGDIDFTRCKSDTYGGYCWQFAETKDIWGNTYYADYAHAEVDLEKTYSSDRNKETNVRATYIHTYTDTEGSISIVPADLVASYITLTGVDDQWKLEIDVPEVVE